MRPFRPVLVEPLRSERVAQLELLSFLLAYFRLLTVKFAASDPALEADDRPVEYEELVKLRVGRDVLLWMLFQRHIQHYEVETSSWGARWREKTTTRIGKGSAFLLTPLGKSFAEILIEKLLVPQEDTDFKEGWDLFRVGDLTPRYDSWNRLLSWGLYDLKQFRQPSESQERILQAAEEMAWVRWFDDPLPVLRGANSKVRLHDTIKNLNRNQSMPFLHFKGDGTGTRIGWELR